MCINYMVTIAKWHVVTVAEWHLQIPKLLELDKNIPLLKNSVLL